MAPLGIAGLVEDIDSDNAPVYGPVFAPSSERSRNALEHSIDLFEDPVFQDADDSPSISFEAQRLAPITINVGSQLLGPEFTTASRAYIVLWAPMPETAVDEHSHSLSPKNDIRTSV